MPDREIWNHLLNKNSRLTRALQAIQNEHVAGQEFLASENVPVPDIPVSLGEAIALAEMVATHALATTIVGDDLDQNTLRGILFIFGRHMDGCPGDDDCMCSWTSIRATLGGAPRVQVTDPT